MEMIECPNCAGTGVCSTCKGTGKDSDGKECKLCWGDGKCSEKAPNGYRCHGTGKIVKD